MTPIQFCSITNIADSKFYMHFGLYDLMLMTRLLIADMRVKVYDNMLYYIMGLLGVTFTLSSIFKCIGLKSFALTVNDFCGFLGLNVLYGHGMLLAIIICSVELALGIVAFIPNLRKYVVWVYTLVLGYFTYITYLNLVSQYGQIESCGCFGEVIHLTPAESFYKNVVLLTLSVLACSLTVYNKKENRNNEVVE